MTNITYNSPSFRLRAEGHSGYGEHGQDIVCAAVSALTQTLALALQGRGICYTMRKSNDRALFEITARPECEQRYPCLVVYETITAGLEQLARDYPDHIKYTATKEAD